MTSKKSSADTFRFTLARTMKKTWYLVLPLFAYTSYLYPIQALIEILEEREDVKEYLTFNKFYLSLSTSASGNICLVALITGIALGAIIYRFVTAKKTTNVYFSLGISRANLFSARFTAGVLLPTIAIFIPLLVSFLANIIYYGSSRELMITAVYHLLVPTAVAILSFAVTACVMSRVGSVLEGMAYSGIIMFIPSIAIFAIETMLIPFGYGNPYERMTAFHTVEGVEYVTAKLSDVFSVGYFNPLAHLITRKYDLAPLLRRTSPAVDFAFETPDFGHVFLWLAVCVAVFFIGLVVFKKRKTENAEFLGADKLLTQICSFMSAIAVSTFIFKYFVDVTSKAAFIAMTLVAILLAYIICEIIIVRSFKQILKGLWKLAAQAAVFGVVCGVFYGGLFGYSSRIPSADDIESVDVSTGTALNLLEPFSSGAVSYYFAEDEAVDTSVYELLSQLSASSSYQSDVLCGFDSKEDIEKIIAVHKQLIELEGFEFDTETANAGGDERPIEMQLTISYNLKNGEKLQRVYPVATVGILRQLVELQNSDVYYDILASRFNLVEPDENGEYFFTNENFGGHNLIGFASKNLTNITLLKDYSLQSEKNREFLAAIRKDIEEKNFPAYTLPTDIPLGYIVICAAYETPKEDNIIDFAKWGAAESFEINSHMSEAFPIFESMTNTVKFIEDNNLGGYIEETQTPVSAKIYNCADREYLPEENFSNYYGNPFTPQFNGRRDFTKNRIGTPESYETVTDAAEIQKLMDVTNYSCMLFDLGYVVEYVLEDGTSVYGCIAAENYAK